MKRKFLLYSITLLFYCSQVSVCMAQDSSNTTPKPRQTTLEYKEDGLIISLRIVTKPNGAETIFTRIKNTRSDKAAVVLLTSDDEKHQIKEVIQPGGSFSGNIGDIRGFGVGLDFVAPETNSDRGGVIDWIKIKIRDHFILNENGLEKKPLDGRGAAGKRG